MARIQCKCGEVLTNTKVPNDIEWVVYSEAEWEEIINQEMIDPINMPLPKHEVWRCTSCERIYVFRQGENTPIKVYRLE